MTDREKVVVFVSLLVFAFVLTALALLAYTSGVDDGVLIGETTTTTTIEKPEPRHVPRSGR